MQINRKFKYFSVILLLIFFGCIAFPAISHAFTCNTCESLVCCGNPGQNACTFEDLFCLVKKVINFILFTIIPPLAAVWFAYAGFLMLTAAGDPGKTKQARDMLLYVVIGILIAYAAWLLVYWFIGFIGGTDQAEWLRQFFE